MAKFMIKNNSYQLLKARSTSSNYEYPDYGFGKDKNWLNFHNFSYGI